MTTPRVSLKRGDTRTAIRAQLLGVDGAPVDLTGATIRFTMATYAGQLLLSRAAEIVDASQGRVRFVFEPPETDRIGLYRAEFEATFSDGRRESYPNTGYIVVEIMPDLG